MLWLSCLWHESSCRLYFASTQSSCNFSDYLPCHSIQTYVVVFRISLLSSCVYSVSLTKGNQYCCLSTSSIWGDLFPLDFLLHQFIALAFKNKYLYRFKDVKKSWKYYTFVLTEIIFIHSLDGFPGIFNCSSRKILCYLLKDWVKLWSWKVLMRSKGSLWSQKSL